MRRLLEVRVCSWGVRCFGLLPLIVRAPQKPQLSVQSHRGGTVRRAKSSLELRGGPLFAMASGFLSGAGVIALIFQPFFALVLIVGLDDRFESER